MGPLPFAIFGLSVVTNLYKVNPHVLGMRMARPVRQIRPEVFVSATGRDLLSTRRMVREALLRLGCVPVEQSSFSPQAGEVRTLLESKLATCDAVVHIAGEAFGTAPRDHNSVEGERSYTQLEFDIAQQLQKPVYIFVCTQGYPYDTHDPEDERRRDLQRAHRARLKAFNDVYHEVDSLDQLEKSVLALETRVNRLATKLAEAQSAAARGIVATCAAAVAVALVVVFVALWLRRGQNQTEVRLKQHVSDTLGDKGKVAMEIGGGSSASVSKYSAAQLAAADQAVQSTDALTRAQGHLIRREYGSADEQLALANKGRPDLYQLYTVTGDRYYFEGKYDKALPWYEHAADLRGNQDIRANSNLALALQHSRRGEVGDNLERAIALHRSILALLTPDTREWATAMTNLGEALTDRPLGSKSANIKEAIDCFQAALTVFTRTKFPLEWAITSSHLGLAWQADPSPDRGSSLTKSIECLEGALNEFSSELHPQRWASAQYFLGFAWWALPTGVRASNIERAIGCYKDALAIRTRESFPTEWAITMNALGLAWADRIVGDPGSNLEQAIACYEDALRVNTRERAKIDWARIKSNLGNAWRQQLKGNRADNIDKAIACYRESLEVRTFDQFPMDWARTCSNLGTAWREKPDANRSANVRNALACYEAALRVRTREAFPQEWAATQDGIGLAWLAMPLGEVEGSIESAMTAFEGALEIRSLETTPAQWAESKRNVGDAWLLREDSSDDERLAKAVQCYRDACLGFERVKQSRDLAATRSRLANALRIQANGRVGPEKCRLLKESLDQARLAENAQPPLPLEVGPSTAGLVAAIEQELTSWDCP